ncbi:MAG: Holliday junction resolvase RuvX [Rhodobacteraceae bacterium]|nr:Holliday junction resolvase RuvX [Paracoccaceae bacterium]
MIHEDMEGFARATGQMGVLIGLDLGTKTIGIAASDVLQSVASAVRTLPRRKFGADADALAGIVGERDAIGLVLGLPRNMDGTEGPRAQSTRAFARNLTRVAGLEDLPIGFWDERLSTVAAERALLEADASRKRRAEVIDAVAASYILQGALDRLRHIRAET